jgi:hypothetical protein
LFRVAVVSQLAPRPREVPLRERCTGRLRCTEKMYMSINDFQNTTKFLLEASKHGQSGLFWPSPGSTLWPPTCVETYSIQHFAYVSTCSTLPSPVRACSLRCRWHLQGRAPMRFTQVWTGSLRSRQTNGQPWRVYKRGSTFCEKIAFDAINWYCSMPCWLKYGMYPCQNVSKGISCI